MVRLPLEKKKKAVDATAKVGIEWTALRFAASRGHEAVSRLLLEHETDVRAKARQTTLHYAAQGEHKAVVQQQQEFAADGAAMAGDGRTALRCAAWDKHECREEW